MNNVNFPQHIEQLNREGRFKTALSEIVHLLSDTPSDQELLSLATITIHTAQNPTTAYVASEPLTSEHIEDPRLDALFCECNKCHSTWMPNPLLTMLGTHFQSAIAFGSPGGFCTKCNKVYCRTCSTTATRAEVSCPVCGSRLIHITKPNGRTPRQLSRRKEKVNFVLLFREGPIPPTREDLMTFFQKISPDVIYDNAIVAAYPQFPWTQDQNDFWPRVMVQFATWKILPTEGAVSDYSIQTGDGTRYFILKVYDTQRNTQTTNEPNVQATSKFFQGDGLESTNTEIQAGINPQSELKTAAISIETIDRLSELEYLGKDNKGPYRYGVVDDFAWSPDGSMIALASQRDVTLIGTKDKVLLRVLDHTGSLGTEALAFSQDGSLILTGTTRGEIRLWRALDGSLMYKQQDLAKDDLTDIQSLAFSPDGREFSFGLRDYAGVLRCRVSDGALLEYDKAYNKLQLAWKILRGNIASVKSVAYSPNGLMLASAIDERIILWNRNGKVVRILKGHKSVVSDIKFSPDGELLASGSWDQSIRLWRVETGTSLKLLKGHKGDVICVAVSKDGKLLVSGSADNTVRLWAVDSGKELRTLHYGSRTHDRVNKVSFSPESRILGAAGNSGMKFWGVTI